MWYDCFYLVSNLIVICVLASSFPFNLRFVSDSTEAEFGAFLSTPFPTLYLVHLHFRLVSKLLALFATRLLAQMITQML